MSTNRPGALHLRREALACEDAHDRWTIHNRIALIARAFKVIVEDISPKPLAGLFAPNTSRPLSKSWLPHQKLSWSSVRADAFRVSYSLKSARRLNIVRIVDVRSRRSSPMSSHHPTRGGRRQRRRALRASPSMWRSHRCRRWSSDQIGLDESLVSIHVCVWRYHVVPGSMRRLALQEGVAEQTRYIMGFGSVLALEFFFELHDVVTDR